MHHESFSSLRRLVDLQAHQPADVTLQDIISLLTAKLALCHKLPVFEYNAASGGDEHVAQTFRDLMVAERASCDRVLVLLRAYLEESAGPTAAIGSADGGPRSATVRSAPFETSKESA